MDLLVRSVLPTCAVVVACAAVANPSVSPSPDSRRAEEHQVASHCALTWDMNEAISEAESARANQTIQSLHIRFSGYADDLETREARGCKFARRWQFAAAWTRVQALERQLQAVVQAHAIQAEERDRTAQAHEDEAVARARALVDKSKHHGYKVLVANGLAGVLDEMIEQGVPVEKAKVAAIVLAELDEDFVATQVFNKGSALFLNKHARARVLLTDYKGTIYQGTSLAALDLEAVTIVGVRTYKTVLGSTAQAFVIKPAW